MNDATARAADQPPPPDTSQRQQRFECTCGWKLVVVNDIDGSAAHVPCAECGGIAVRRSFAGSPR